MIVTIAPPLVPRAAAVDDFDPRTMLVDDLFHHRKTKAGTARFARHIRLECTAKYICRKSRPIVFNIQAHGACLCIRLFDFDQFGSHENARIGPAGQCVLRIDQQVVNHLAQLRCIPFDQR